MAGIDEIVRHIEEEASKAAQNELEIAKKKADEILSAARIEAEKKSAEIMEQAKAEMKAGLERADSAANLQRKKLILNAKQEIITDVIQKAKASLNHISDREYFDIIIRMVKKYALGERGQILFSPEDKGRLPDQFESMIHSALSDKTGAVLSVSDAAGNIDGGFVLIYGDVEVNCSFEALFSAAKETFQDKVRDFLFQ